MHCLRHVRLFLVLVLAIAGCRSGNTNAGVIASAPPPPLGRFKPTASPQIPPQSRDVHRLQPAAVVPTAHVESDSTSSSPRFASVEQAEPLPNPSFSNRSEAPSPPTLSDYDRLVVEGSSLTLEQLVSEVEVRNPSLQAMIAAWQAAAQKYPQAVALDDPMFMAMLAPGALGDRDVSGGQQLQVTQRFPWPGKRRVRGDMVQNEADAAYHEAEDFRVQLALITESAFFDYYLVLQEQRLNRENTEIMQRFRETAQVRYQTNLVTQQDVLQADVELHELERRRLELKRMERVAVARINTLLRRQPDAPMPTPAALPAIEAPEEASLLIGQALSQRQDLAALVHRIEAEEAALALAYKDFLPDVDVVGAYNSMMPEKAMWGQVGVGLNIPLYLRRRRAAVDEVQFRIGQRVAEYEQKQLDIQYEVQAAYERVEESRQTVDLYKQKLIPTAQQNVEATRANYENAKATFLDLAVAQRQLVELREKEQEALVSLRQRQAELQRAIGGR